MRSDCFPYHVTARSNNKELFPGEQDLMWKVITSELYLLTLTHEIEIQSFVLMPNHFHLIITVPKADLGVVMNLLMSAVTKSVNYYTSRSGHVFGGPYFWSLITATRYYGHAFKYVYRNPVRARICDQVEEYRFSTLHGLLGQSALPFPLTYTRLGMEINLPEQENHNAWLDWLNRPFPMEAEKLIRKAMSLREMKTLLNRQSRKPVQELEDFL
ncbi:MAG: transposase [Bdellovibrionales bacterium]|nr:transposase [Oligoflexia bacterium]